jgi:hypothetical protein
MVTHLNKNHFYVYFTFSFFRTFNNHPFIPDGIHSRIITDDDGTQTLLIDKTLPDDAGVYAVMATNNRGTASTRGILDVQRKFILELEAKYRNALVYTNYCSLTREERGGRDLEL